MSKMSQCLHGGRNDLVCPSAGKDQKIRIFTIPLLLIVDHLSLRVICGKEEDISIPAWSRAFISWFYQMNQKYKTENKFTSIYWQIIQQGPFTLCENNVYSNLIKLLSVNRLVLLTMTNPLKIQKTLIFSHKNNQSHKYSPTLVLQTEGAI